MAVREIRLLEDRSLASSASMRFARRCHHSSSSTIFPITRRDGAVNFAPLDRSIVTVVTGLSELPAGSPGYRMFLTVLEGRTAEKPSRKAQIWSRVRG